MTITSDHRSPFLNFRPLLYAYLMIPVIFIMFFFVATRVFVEKSTPVLSIGGAIMKRIECSMTKHCTFPTARLHATREQLRFVSSPAPSHSVNANMVPPLSTTSVFTSSYHTTYAVRENMTDHTPKSEFLRLNPSRAGGLVTML